MSEYQPRIDHDEGTVAGQYTSTPVGVILHGSRSGIAGRSVQAEYDGCRAYAARGIELGWSATVGHDAVSLHMSPAAWGWNARAASSRYLAVEFAQPTVNDPITDGQVRAFCWWLQRVALARWPTLDVTRLPMHSELPEGVADGKSDVFPRGDSRSDELRARIAARLAETAEEDDLSVEERQELDRLRSYVASLFEDTLKPVAATLDDALAVKGRQGWGKVAEVRNSLRGNLGI